MTPRIDAPFQVVGRSPVKPDGMPKVLGRPIFADDLVLPRMAFAKLHRSSRPHARIRRIDFSEARKLPGVLAVLSGADLPTRFGILPVSQDETALAVDRVRYVGDPVAAVCALDEETAEEAARLVRVEYEELPPVMSIEEGLHAPVPLHEGGNVQKAVSLEFGDTERALAEADLVQEDTFFYQGNTHLPMEQHAALAMWDTRLTLWSSTQTPHYVHRALAKVLGLPPQQIRVIATPNGGGFGGKSDIFGHEIVVAKLAMMTGRPVKITLTREEVFYAHRGRHPVLMRVRTGVRRDGRITGMQFQSFLDGGAFGSYGVASTYYTGALQTSTYRIPAYRFQGLRVFTNKPPCGPKRGHGTPQPRYAVEIQLDKIAERLGIDPVELRKRNLVEPHSVTANWLSIGSCALGRCLDAVVQASGWREKFRRMPFGRGVGLAASAYICGAGLPIYYNAMPHTGVHLKLDRSGLVTAFCGETDIGQGSDAVLAMIVAEVLGLDPNLDVRVVPADTDLTPVDLGSYSSRVTLMMGNAAIQAAERAREWIAAAFAEKKKISKERVAFAGRRVFDAGNPEDGVPFAEAVQWAEAKFGSIGTAGSYVPPVARGKYKGAGVGPSPAYSYTACVAEVEVDPETGWIRVPKVWIAHDIGRAIHRINTIGQVEGSVYMGLGEILMEEQAFRRNVHRCPSMLDYKSPTTLEMCDVETILIEDPDPNGPFGAKEVGQGPLLPVPPAVANAVYDAVRVRIDETPITPEKVLRALRSKAKGKGGRLGPEAVPEFSWPAPLRIKTPWEGGDGTAMEKEVAVHRGGAP